MSAVDIGVLIVIAGIITFSVIYRLKRKKSGCTGCEHCQMKGECHGMQHDANSKTK